MPSRRSPVLAFVLALALVAYPATMPLAMAAEMASAMQRGEQRGAMHHPGPQHHAVATCCAGVCACCPVPAVVAGASPAIVNTAVHVRVQRTASAPVLPASVRRLPYSIGPPVRLV